MAVMATGHPLAARERLRLRECAADPLALPERSFGGRQTLDEILAATSTEPEIQLEANSFELLRNFVRHTRAVTFQIEIGAPSGGAEGVVARPLDDRDLAHGPLVLGQLKGRTLPVAVAKFADGLTSALDASRSLPTV